MSKRNTRILTAVHCALYLFLSFVSAQDNRTPDPNNHFISPPEPGPQATVDPTVFWSNQNWTVGVQQSIDWNWVTNLTNLMITLQQEGNPDGVQARTILDCPDASTNNLIYWDGDITPIDLKNGSIAYLAAWDCDQPDATPIFFSHYINLTEPAVPVTSSKSTTATSMTTSSSSNSAPTNTTPPTSSTPAPTASPADTKSGSNATALGGGIGGGIGGALVLIALVGLFIFWRRGKKNKSSAGLRQEMNSPTKHELLPPKAMYPPNPYQDTQHGYRDGPTEMPSDSTAQHYQHSNLASSAELESTSHSGTGSQR